MRAPWVGRGVVGVGDWRVVWRSLVLRSLCGARFSENMLGWFCVRRVFETDETPRQSVRIPARGGLWVRLLCTNEGVMVRSMFCLPSLVLLVGLPALSLIGRLGLLLLGLARQKKG